MTIVLTRPANMNQRKVSPDEPQRMDCARDQTHEGSNLTAGSIDLLHRTIERLERANAAERAKVNELAVEVASLRAYFPSFLAEEILLHFCAADTTELAEREIFAARPEIAFEVHIALKELCANKLLVVENDGPEKRYVITVRGQEMCYTGRH